MASSSPAQGSGSSRKCSPGERRGGLTSASLPGSSCLLLHPCPCWERSEILVTTSEKTAVFLLCAAESPGSLLSLLRAVCLQLTLQLHLHRSPHFPRFTFLKVSLFSLLPLASAGDLSETSRFCLSLSQLPAHSSTVIGRGQLRVEDVSVCSVPCTH